MKINFDIDVHHVTRIEGHGNIKVSVSDGKIADCSWDVVETPRFFEAMLKGKKYDVVAPITSRICGICSVGHTLASVRATERAMKIPVSPQTSRLRLLLKHGETIQSHVLHVFFLVAPDLFSKNSVLPLVKSHPGIVMIGARLKKLGNDICALVGGRQTHPQSVVPGGFLKVPTKSELGKIRERLAVAMKDLHNSLGAFIPLALEGPSRERNFSSHVEALVLMGLYPFPDFARETEFVSLKADREYPFIGGKLISSDGVIREEDEYLQMTNEFLVPQSTAKWARLSRDSFFVGALARFNNNYLCLSPAAKKIAEELGIHPVCHNPFFNTIAQLVETAHCIEDADRLIQELLDSDVTLEKIDFSVSAGRGVGAVEVPRGILYHEYEYDNKGRIRKANCIIPTNQNHANIQYDLEELVAKYHKMGWGSQEIEKLAQILVRAYDPCVSCSVH